MPGAWCARRRMCESRKQKAHALVRSHRKHPAFPAQWFTTYFVLSPVIGLFCHRRPRKLLSTNLTPASRRQDHTTSPSASVPFVKGASASIASRSASVTIASRPSCGTRRVNYRIDLALRKIRIFLYEGLDILNTRFGKTTRRANQSTQSIPEQSALKPGKIFIAQMRANSQSEMPSRRMFRNERRRATQLHLLAAPARIYRQSNLLFWRMIRWKSQNRLPPNAKLKITICRFYLAILFSRSWF
jgi:hypothetical protein